MPAGLAPARVNWTRVLLWSVVLLGLTGTLVYWISSVAPWPMILVSSDGSHWTTHRAAQEFRSVTFGAGRFVAVGDHGNIVTSADATSWTYAPPVTDQTLLAIIYGNGQFVAVGQGGTILTSSDGLRWDKAATPSNTWLVTVAYGGGRYMAGGQNDSNLGILLTSDDGLHWTSQKPPTKTPIWEIAYGADTFVVVAHSGGPIELLVSPDGVNWVGGQDVHNSLQGLAFGAGKFVAGGIDTVYTSTAGLEWAETAWPDGIQIFFKGLVYAGSQFVAAGDRSTDGLICTSPDGTNWIVRSVFPSRPVRSVTYGNGYYVAVATYDWGIH